MLLKNAAGGVYLYAVDTTASPYLAKTGDQANITGSWSKDGGAETAGFTTANPTSIGGGVYWQPLTAAETNGDMMSYRWSSSTSGVVIQPALVGTDARPAVRKNVALGAFTFPMIGSADHVTRQSGATVTLTRSIDGGVFGASANSVVEIGSTGFYKVDLAGSDLNGTVIVLKATATACDDTELTIITQP